ncbi:EAL domain-containing protein [Azonexus sp. IMCC34839]|uniref:bifunctional diguanylate cyclase/phosphodiesterase n=1 Tax=Azonexus sp. IMCC34839 TaxID=3133695 RepID=UPI003999D758
MNSTSPTSFDSLLLEHADDLLLLVDPQTQRICAANRATCTRLGYEHEQLLERPITDIGRSLADIFYWEEVAAGNIQEVESSEGLYRCADGSLFPVDERISLVDHDKRRWLLIRAHDITHQRDEKAHLESLTSLLRATLESTADGILVCDERGHLINMNQRFAALWQLPEDILARGDDGEVIAFMAGRQDDAEGYLARFADIIRLHEEHTLDTLELDSGQVLEQRSQPQYLEERIIGRVFTFTDITQRRAAERQLKQSEAAFRSLVEGSPDIIIRYDSDCRAVYVNQMLEVSTQLDRSMVLGQTPTGRVFEGDRDREHYEAALRQVIASGEPQEIEIQVRSREDEPRIHHVRMAAERGESGVVGALAFGRDITDIIRAEVELRIAAIAFESLEAIAITDAEERIIKVNRSFCRITGYSAEEALGKTPGQLLKSGRHDPMFYAEMWRALTYEKHWQGEVWNRRKNGDIYPEWLNITAVTDPAGRICNYVAAFSDISLHKKAEAEIHTLAFYDPLTALPNRRLLLDRLEHTMASSARNKRHGAVLILDLDRFKELNDTKGHNIGDLLLIEVANRLQECVRADDTVARLGGDEFVVILVDLGPNPRQAAAQAEIIAEKMRSAINRPFTLQSSEYHTSPSIGICLFGNQEISIDELLKRADTAMYQAKRSGRNTIRFFDPATHAAMEARIALDTDLRRALPEDQLLLYFQPQIEGSGRIQGAEALLRWQHPKQGMVSPLVFISLAEDTGLIVPIGQWVLETACRQLKAWENDSVSRYWSLAVNVSAHQFRQDNFVEHVLSIVEKTDIDPSLLKLELTESLVLDNVDDTIAKMQALKAAGICFSLDDFGTGYSSLAYLSRLPLDQVKIDQSFVRNIGVTGADEVIIQTILGMAENLGLEAIAEGVETEEQLEFLRRNGCTYFQGYLFGRPIPIDDFHNRHRTND